MKWITVLLLAAASLSCAGTGASSPRTGAPGLQPSFGEAGGEPAVVYIAQADRDRLFDAVVDIVRPFQIATEDRAGGHVVSGDFGIIEQGIPRFRYIEVRMKPADATGGRYKVGVAVYLYQRRFRDGSPVGDENEEFEWVYLGLDVPSQEQFANDIFRAYLEGR